jgi:hypothetical protein
MSNDKSRKRLPPYISYRTFENFIGRLEQQIPARIDRSYWGETLSGSTGTQLMAALHFLNLVDNNGRPTNQLKLVASARGEHKSAALREITWDAYDFVLQSSLDLQNATYAQLEEVFHDNFQLTSEVGRKCIKFFISLASSAGTTLSPFMTKRVRLTHTVTGTAGTRNVLKKARQRASRNVAVPHNREVPVEATVPSLEATLLAKFPAFDPSWTDEVKSNWFNAFDKLLKRFPIRA